MKKIICLLIVLFLFMLTPYSDTYAFEFSANTPKDIDEHWAEQSIETLNSLGVMNGFDGYTNPDDIITRGEFTALITRAFGLKPGQSSKNFKDITKNHIFYDAIAAASNSGIIDGFEDSTFRPDNMITREEIMLIIWRVSPGYASVLADFDDISSSYIYIPQLSKIVEDKIIGGYPDGTFKPYNKTTRAEAAKMIVNAMNKYMAPSDSNNTNSFALNYILWHFSDIETANANSVGVAKKDIEHIKNTYDIAAAYGYVVSNMPSDVKIVSANHTGPFAETVLEYNVKNLRNNNVKNYKGQSKIYTITQNEITKVYRHDTTIKEDYFINLTWEVYSSSPSYSTKGVNIVSPTSYRIETDPEGNSQKISFDQGTLYFNSTLTNNYLNYAKTNGYKVWAMYKTDFKVDTASLFLNNNSARKQAASILIGEIVKNNLDGINFDFENMYQKDKGAYTNHVKEISIAAHTLGAAVSVDVTKYEKTSSTWSMCYNRDSLAEYADYIMLMAYDQYYPGSKTPGPVAGFAWTENCINLTLKEVPKEKLVLGMPYYVRIWEVSGGKSKGSISVSMTEALRQIDENSATAEFDSKHGLTKYTWTQKDGKTKVLWLENAQSIAQRVALAKKYSLAGIASWRRGFETLDVWDAIYNELNK